MDDLTRINGIGKATAKKLAAAGIDTIEKLAHDGVAGRDGVEAGWIEEAAKLLAAENGPEEETASEIDSKSVTLVAESRPRLAAAAEALRANLPAGFDGTVKVRVTALVAGRRRAGRAHFDTATYDTETFSPDQLEELLADPKLRVEFVVGEGHA